MPGPHAWAKTCPSCSLKVVFSRCVGSSTGLKPLGFCLLKIWSADEQPPITWELVRLSVPPPPPYKIKTCISMSSPGIPTHGSILPYYIFHIYLVPPPLGGELSGQSR